MFGFAVGMLTEYATGSDFVDQVKILLSNFGIVDLEWLESSSSVAVYFLTSVIAFLIFKPLNTFSISVIAVS